MNIPAHLRYTSSHEWLRRESDGTVTVGITDHAQAGAGLDVARGEFVAPLEGGERGAPGGAGSVGHGAGRPGRGARARRQSPITA